MSNTFFYMPSRDKVPAPASYDPAFRAALVGMVEQAAGISCDWRQRSQATAGRVVYVEGEVWIERDGSRTPPSVGATLREGDRVVTAEGPWHGWNSARKRSPRS